MRHRANTTAGLALIALALTGCGSDGNKNAADEKAVQPVAAVTAEQPGATSPFCAAAKTLNETPEGDLATMTPEKVRQTIKKYFTDRLNALDDYERLMPKDNATPGAVYVRIARHIAETGDLSEFDTPENLVPIKADEAYHERVCGIAPPG